MIDQQAPTQVEIATQFARDVRAGRAAWHPTDYKHVSSFGRSTGFVYFAVTGDDIRSKYIKIGYTGADPHARISSLQTGCPTDLRMMGYMFGNLRMERQIHSLLRDYRSSGEWFLYSWPVLVVIRALLRGRKAR